jgi:hypothetical protein
VFWGSIAVKKKAVFWGSIVVKKKAVFWGSIVVFAGLCVAVFVISSSEGGAAMVDLRAWINLGAELTAQGVKALFFFFWS